MGGSTSTELEMVQYKDPFAAHKKVQIQNSWGLHGRPTTAFVKLANRFVSEVLVSRDGQGDEVNGKSALAVLGLGVEPGSVLRIRARGPDALEAVTALTSLVHNKFVEDATAAR
jgi:phosphocarrier protein